MKWMKIEMHADGWKENRKQKKVIIGNSGTECVHVCVRCVCTSLWSYFFIHFLSTQSTLSKKVFCCYWLEVTEDMEMKRFNTQHEAIVCVHLLLSAGSNVYTIFNRPVLSLFLSLMGKRRPNSMLHTSHTSLINIWPLRRVLKRRKRWRKKNTFCIEWEK